MYSAGFMLEYGQGVNHDYEQALKYYEQAAEPGDVDAMYRAGLIYANLDGKYRTTSIPEKAGGFERSDQTDTSGFVRRDQDNTGESVCSDTVESYTGTSSDVTGVWYVRKAKQGDLELDTSINA